MIAWTTGQFVVLAVGCLALAMLSFQSVSRGLAGNLRLALIWTGIFIVVTLFISIVAA